MAEFKSIEQKEIRGVTWKVLWTIVCSAVAGVLFGVSQSNRILKEIRDNRTQTEIQAIQIKQLEVGTQTLSAKQEKLDMDIRDIKVQLALDKRYIPLND